MATWHEHPERERVAARAGSAFRSCVRLIDKQGPKQVSSCFCLSSREARLMARWEDYRETSVSWAHTGAFPIVLQLLDLRTQACGCLRIFCCSGPHVLSRWLSRAGIPLESKSTEIALRTSQPSPHLCLSSCRVAAGSSAITAACLGNVSKH